MMISARLLEDDVPRLQPAVTAAEEDDAGAGPAPAPVCSITSHSAHCASALVLTGEELGAGVDGDEAAAQHVVRPHPGRPVPHLHSGATCIQTSA